MSLLLLGSETAFRDEVSMRLLTRRDFTVLARTTSLLQGIECLESKAIDVVLVSPEFNDDELRLFTLDARRYGFSGLILRAADGPELSACTGKKNDHPIQVGDFFLEVESRRVWVRGSEVFCWAQEFDLLHFFCRHPEELLSYQGLIDTVWREPTTSRQMLRALVRDLKAKIETTSTSRYIVEHRLFGYRFIPSPTPASKV
jgi:DNA-binding winged helix-turn-helix (wHTH) protein